MKAFMTVCAILASASAQYQQQLLYSQRGHGGFTYVQPSNYVYSPYAYYDGYPIYASVNQQRLFKREAESSEEGSFAISSKVSHPSKAAYYEYKVNVDQNGNGRSYQLHEQKDSLMDQLPYGQHQSLKRAYGLGRPTKEHQQFIQDTKEDKFAQSHQRKYQNTYSERRPEVEGITRQGSNQYLQEAKSDQSNQMKTPYAYYGRDMSGIHTTKPGQHDSLGMKPTSYANEGPVQKKEQQLLFPSAVGYGFVQYNQPQSSLIQRQMQPNTYNGYAVHGGNLGYNRQMVLDSQLDSANSKVNRQLDYQQNFRSVHRQSKREADSAFAYNVVTHHDDQSMDKMHQQTDYSMEVNDQERHLLAYAPDHMPSEPVRQPVNSVRGMNNEMRSKNSAFAYNNLAHHDDQSMDKMHQQTDYSMEANAQEKTQLAYRPSYMSLKSAVGNPTGRMENAMTPKNSAFAYNVVAHHDDQSMDKVHQQTDYSMEVNAPKQPLLAFRPAYMPSKPVMQPGNSVRRMDNAMQFKQLVGYQVPLNFQHQDRREPNYNRYSSVANRYNQNQGMVIMPMVTGARYPWIGHQRIFKRNADEEKQPCQKHFVDQYIVEEHQYPGAVRDASYAMTMTYRYGNPSSMNYQGPFNNGFDMYSRPIQRMEFYKPQYGLDRYGFY